MTTPRFVPSTEELSKIDRDLRFHPSTTEHPAALTPGRLQLLIATVIWPAFGSSMRKRSPGSVVTLMNCWPGRSPQGVTATRSARRTSAIDGFTTS